MPWWNIINNETSVLVTSLCTFMRIFSVWFLFVYDHFNRYERKQLHELFGHDLFMFIRHRCRRIQRYWSVNQRISP